MIYRIQYVNPNLVLILIFEKVKEQKDLALPFYENHLKIYTIISLLIRTNIDEVRMYCK